MGDLLEHLPSRYLSYDSARPVAGLADGEEATIRVVLDAIRVVPPLIIDDADIDLLASAWPGALAAAGLA